MKNIRLFLSENFQFFEVKFSVYLKACFRNVFIFRSQYNRVRDDAYFIGSTYKKARYREYTDATFNVAKSDIDNLGILGPFVHAGVGDVIKVVFKNAAARSYSMHPQGLKYNKTYEGMVYQDGHAESSGDNVSPGSTFTYYWEVPATAGPAPDGPNCIGSMYHSAVDPVKDTYAGLVGPLVICRAGILEPTSSTRRDSVEKEFALLFSAFDENESPYLDENIATKAPSADKTNEEFQESNKYDSVNGYIYNNLLGLVMDKGDNVAWYILGLGSNEDIHTAHFHGQAYVYRKKRPHRADVVEVFPGTYETVYMFCENPGTWLIHCHVGEHTIDGMITTFKIEDTVPPILG